MRIITATVSAQCEPVYSHIAGDGNGVLEQVCFTGTNIRFSIPDYIGVCGGGSPGTSMPGTASAGRKARIWLASGRSDGCLPDVFVFLFFPVPIVSLSLLPI